MEIKVSYVQARRFIDFHTLILNSYIKIIRKTAARKGVAVFCINQSGTVCACG